MNAKQPFSPLSDSQENEDRYLGAQAFMQGYANQDLVQSDNVKPIWINSSDSFWYERLSKPDEDLSEITDTKLTTKLVKEYFLLL